MLETPVLLLIFNRPSQTRKVFDRIRELKPRRLFVVADGARLNNSEDVENCRASRAIIEEGVDWDCSLKTLFRPFNLGCGPGVSQGIDWFFDQVEYGIVLEDDCLPHPSFFSFCEILLKYYEHSETVMSICGSNFQFGKKRGAASYYLSHYSHVWGWATWKRAWRHYSFSMPDLSSFLKSKNFADLFDGADEKEFWTDTLQAVQVEKDTWDYQWQYAIWKQQGLVIFPNVNLVANLGFGAQATHTRQNESRLSEMETKRLSQITHPSKIIRDKAADVRFFAMVHLLRPHASFQHRVMLKLRKIFFE